MSGCAASKFQCWPGTSVPGTTLAPVILPGKATTYKASIDVLKNHLTGLLIVKQTDSVTTHIVFVTELGMKMFDFEARDHVLKAVYVFEPLNKPALINALLRNFSNMFLLNAQGHIFTECRGRRFDRVVQMRGEKESWYYGGKAGPPGELFPLVQETFYRGRRSTKTEYVTDSFGTTQRYSRITAKQYGIVKFYFELNAISTTP